MGFNLPQLLPHGVRKLTPSAALSPIPTQVSAVGLPPRNRIASRTRACCWGAHRIAHVASVEKDKRVVETSARRSLCVQAEAKHRGSPDEAGDMLRIVDVTSATSLHLLGAAERRKAQANCVIHDNTSPQSS